MNKNQEKIAGYDFLELIHLTLFHYEQNEAIKRYKDDSEEYKIINNCVNNLLELDLCANINQISYIIAKNLSVIYMYQPFSDGNTRTISLFFNYLLSHKYNVSVEQLDNIHNKGCLYSTLYYKDDEPSKTNVLYIQEKLSLTRKRFRLF